MSLLLVDVNQPPEVPAPLASARLPLRRDRPLCVGYRDSVALGRADVDYASIRIDGERALLWDGGQHVELKVGAQVHKNVGFSLVDDKNNPVITEPQLFGPFVVFNTWANELLGADQRSYPSVSMRAVRTDDPERTIIDVTAWMGDERPRHLRRTPVASGSEGEVWWEANPSCAGLSLAQLVAENAIAAAGMDASIASALVKPLVAGLDPRRHGRRPTTRTIIVDFDGVVRHFPERVWGPPAPHVYEPAALLEARMRLLVVYGALLGDVPPPDAPIERMLVEPAPREDIARFIRAIAPAAWADEQRVREEAALVVDAMLAGPKRRVARAR